MLKIRIHARDRETQTVIIEPWAEEYVADANGFIDLHIRDTDEVDVHCSDYKQSLVVYPNTKDFVVLKNGVQLAP